MSSAELLKILKMNMRKLGPDKRAFFYAFDKSKNEHYLFVERKFDNPKRYGNLKKINAMLKKVFNFELHKSSRFCAGTVFNDDTNTSIFQPTLQKANVALLKKGLNTTFKLQVGSWDFQLGESGDGAAAPLDSAGLNRIRTKLEQALSAFQDGNDPQKAKAGPEALDLIDEFVLALAGDETDDVEGRLNIPVQGRSLRAWQDLINDWEPDVSEPEDEAELEETIAELMELKEEARLAEEELQQASRDAEASQKRLDAGNTAVTNQLLDRNLAGILKGGALTTPEQLPEKLKEKASKAVMSHGDNTYLLEQTQLKLKLTQTKIETELARREAAARQKEFDETEGRLANTCLDLNLLASLRGQSPPSLNELSPKITKRVGDVFNENRHAKYGVTIPLETENILYAEMSLMEAQRNLERSEDGQFSEQRLQTREISKCNLASSYAKIRRELASLRRAIPPNLDQIGELEAFSKQFQGLEQLSLQLDGCALEYNQFIENLQSLSEQEQVSALSQLQVLRSRITTIKQQVEQFA